MQLQPWARRRARVSVVVPVYDVEAYLPACLDSVLAQEAKGLDLEVVVVDDGSPDGSGAIADSYAERDPRVRVVHTTNRGLGAARNEGLRHVTGDLVAFADSDDVVPPGAYAALLRQLRRTGSDFVTGSVARWEGDSLAQLPWMRRLHATRSALVIDHQPEILGDVFAWNKLFRRDFYEGVGLSWPEGVRYEDQPTTTDAYLRARRFGVIPEVVYHWRIRHDGSSITQQRSSLTDLRDRWATKQMALASVEAYGSAKVTRVFRDRVLAGDLHRYFAEIPGCSDEWWELLRTGVLQMYGARSLTHSGLTPAYRLVGWLVEQGRREDAAAVVAYVRSYGGPLPRVPTPTGPRIDVPVIDLRTVAPAALELRPHEA
ncbi:glycosyltransferase family 2 protein [Nocardioides marmotae]|uniref:glycosyltransferase family 2 protein n=1 Tax=Nocardioides marmotae TaxID=2663857 RepID=UPI0012B59244|nr:glycosyltransferase family 2 protein [Nocardioides marmotae]MBC9732924.1 glycosyltransferase family 2 protein [Nocardioides marmotae]MTB84038.1 glycosyltransferase [Nocardioides marmotae]